MEARQSPKFALGSERTDSGSAIGPHQSFTSLNPNHVVFERDAASFLFTEVGEAERSIFHFPLSFGNSNVAKSQRLFV
jgi:hypothetical protein